MNNYAETKKKVDAIRDKYGCKGEVLFRTAIQMIVEHGQDTFSDEDQMNAQFAEIDARHDKADAEHKILFMSREFEKALIECAMELAQIHPYNLLMYIQKEVWLGGDGISYQRAMELLKYYIEYIYSNNDGDYEATLDELYCRDFSSEEIEELGYGFLLDVKEEEE